MKKSLKFKVFSLLAFISCNDDLKICEIFTKHGVLF